MSKNPTHLLIVKFGALGDVVRTSYFAKALKNKYGNKLRLSWLTSAAAKPLLQFNPYIDDIWIAFEEAQNHVFDIVYSLDDEDAIVRQVDKLNANQLVGAIVDLKTSQLSYTDDSSEWFDMGLLSKFGKQIADQKKKNNIRSHAAIFSNIFKTELPEPEFFKGPEKFEDGILLERGSNFVVGINPYAGGRWSSKELPKQELEKLIEYFLTAEDLPKKVGKLVLLGAGVDHVKNLSLEMRLQDDRVFVPNTDDSILKLADVIGSLDYLITSDSLAMHLAIAQKIPFLAFFAPTSAAEIDDFGFGKKLCSTAEDYCSYAKEADNSSITHERLLGLIRLSLNGSPRNA